MTVDRPREFLDTNVIVYAYDRSAGNKRARAIELLDRAAGEGSAALSVQVLQEFFVTVTRKLPTSLPVAEAAGIVADLSTLPTHVPTGTDVLAAIDLHERLRLSFWDAMVIRSASRLGCSVLWSEDFSAERTYAGVEVRNPFRA